MNNFNQTGISVWRVRNASKNAAIKSMGKFVIAIITPSFAPCFKASMRLRVPGKSQLFATIKPEAAEITKVDNSKVPCNKMVSKLSDIKPLL